MDEINERIKTVVSKSGLTKTAFAERLNITQAYVSALCLGKKTPSDRTIIDICREFNVNETWLRTGEGEMFVQQDREGEIMLMVQKLLSGKSSDFKARFISVLTGLKEEQWLVLEEKMNEIIGSRTDSPAAPAATPSSAELAPTQAQNLVKELAELKHQNEEIMRRNQEMAAEIAAIREEDAAIEAEERMEQNVIRSQFR